MSWKIEVIANASGTWSSSGLRFATEQEAEDYALDLSMRWMMVRQTRVVEVDEPVTCQWAGFGESLIHLNGGAT